MKTSALLFVGLAGCAVVLGAACASKPAAQQPSAERNANAADSSRKQRVIILCTGNSCRSQMAEAFWRKYAGDRWEVVSAGTKPSGKVSPLAIQAMAEKGIDISQQQSKSVAPFTGQPFDLVITVCSDAERACPTFPGGRKHIHHGFDDPPKMPGTDEDRLRICRRVRDEIETQVRKWIETETRRSS